MATPAKPWKAEYAKSSRSSCKSCKNAIAKDVLRLGKMVQATQFDGFMPASTDGMRDEKQCTTTDVFALLIFQTMRTAPQFFSRLESDLESKLWNHASCIFKKGSQIKSVDDVEGVDLLRWEDQQKIRNYVEGGVQETTAVIGNESVIEISATSRAACRRCSEKISKGMVRVSMKSDGQGARGLMWYHVKCFIDLFPSTHLEKLSGWDNLPTHDREDVLARKSASTVRPAEVEDKAPLQQPALRVTKRKQTAKNENGSKISKTKGNTAAQESEGRSDDGVSGQIESSRSNIESKLEQQSNALWALKDELKKHVTTLEMREMLEANGQDSAGSEYDLRERCADGMLFGALGNCPLCSGSLYYSGGQYRCHGYLSAWSKCSFSTTEPVRLKVKWKIPEETSNQFLLKWFKSQRVKKSERVLPQSSSKPSVGHFTDRFSESSGGKGLETLKVAMAGKLKETMEDWKSKLESAGGEFHAKVKKGTNCLVVSGDVDDTDSELRKARRMKLPIVREDYLADSIRQQKKLPFDLYKVESVGESSKSGTLTVKVKGRSAVHESSGLQDSGHILEDGKSIYNSTLNMSDLSTGINSYYILQIIQEDKGSDCYVFRKWGRVGNDKIGGKKLEQMSKFEAINEFKRLFLEKTGNTWETWEQKQNFEKQPGRFLPLDIDYGIKQAPKRKDSDSTKSLLAPQLVELMKMLFDVETYRAAMMEFEINMSEMPLGKLSKENIQKGFEALTEIQNLLNDAEKWDSSVKKSLIVDASNRFFTLIPSIHPHVISDTDDFKAKVKMLEALQDIEIASRLVGFDNENDESFDDKYRKLNCDIVPLSHDSEDYTLLEKYLLNTHAPTHKDWTLELIDAFSLEREGESDKYASFREKLQNKMLLWHGSRLTNFVGILSQGLRIAPPEAPATGYMFGKGIYFADLVSKSAQYCYVDKKDPVGLLLLSEVALGEMYELKKASYMERPPRGKHSTKGLGKTIPLESEFVEWRDQVVVPCGKPVPSSVRASELLYNEYIVYSTAQVKMQFLLKVRFHHKR